MNENKKRIAEKIKELENFLMDLEDYLPINFEEYLNQSKTKDACERSFEKIVMAMIDLGFLIVKENKFKIPEEESEVFDVLAKEDIISDGLKNKLKAAKGMRNILAHEYGRVDNELVFESLKNEIIKDADEFTKIIKKRLK